MALQQTKTLWTNLLLAVGMLSSFIAARPETERETRSVGAFTEVNLGGSARVVLKQGSPQSVVVEASPEALAEFETVVNGGQLRLANRNKMGNYKDQGPVTVYITAPSLTALRVGGSGKFEVNGPLKADAMKLDVSGSGKLQVPQLTASSLETNLSGSGDLLVGGTCPRQQLRISGSGQVKAHDLKSETCQARISGSGDAHVYASRSADASISGSGSVYVAGGAQLSSSVHGSGRIVKE
ncbi:head GIN domain-containing protein [Hymenobacter negativus]|uniref:DUF2807 domain-containing protein n=1 Tax=Hymenobacter negativus TaxID=2795026 RepID=A0ABS3QCB3_9BACT|nr:head GIN domain-containing protein [Hymenobacter negativus]MBO2008603.1 DUF2807 domain-containing protein [Hymenobacter negativus]